MSAAHAKIRGADENRPGRGLTLATAVVQETARRLFDTARLEIRQQASGDRVTITPDVAAQLQGPGLDARDALARLARLLQAPSFAEATEGKPVR